MSTLTIPLTTAGEGRRTVDLNGTIVTVVTRYNHAAECWMMDVLDVEGETLLAGLMLVPGVDILKAHQRLKATLGTMIVFERNAGDYKSPDKLGVDVVLTWGP
jgi:hypothetical protein